MSLLTEGQRVFARYGISADELRWTGRPRSGLRLHRGDVFMIPFSLLWGGFAIFWETGVVRDGASWFFMLWGVPFVAVGLYMIVGRFFWDAYCRSRTWYGLTSDSALIVRGGSIQRVYLPAVTSFSLELGSNGTGTIVFGEPHYYDSKRVFDWSGGPGAPSFEGVAGAQRVYDLCTGSQRAAVPHGAAASSVR